MSAPTLAVVWVQDGARFEEREGPCWVPMRTSEGGITVFADARPYCGTVHGWRSDNGREVRCGCADVFDVVTVAAR